MINARLLAALLAAGALAAAPAFAQGQKIPPSRTLGQQPAAAGAASTQQAAGNAENAGNQAEIENGPLTLSDIAQVQRHLKQMGAYHGSIDGKWGPLTRKAVEEVQKQQGMQPTGTLDIAAAQQLGLLDQNTIARKQAEKRFQGRNGASTRVGSATSPGGMQQLYGGGLGGGSDYVNGSFTSPDVFSPGAAASSSGAGSPQGFFGYSSNMSNGFNASRGR